MENLKKLLNFLSPLPGWLRVVIAALITIVVSVCMLTTASAMFSSCGITQSTVNNFNSDNNTIEMGVTPSTTTSTTVSPEIPINAPLKNSMWAVFVLLNFLVNGNKSCATRRICVDADDEDDAFNKISLFLDAFHYSECDRIDSYEVINIFALPPLFYWD